MHPGPIVGAAWGTNIPVIPVPSWTAMPSHQHDRAASTLLREISRIVSRDVRDPDVATVRVSQVSLSPDKRSARVLVAPWDPVVGEEPDPAALRALVRATPFIRKMLARNLRMRYVPELRFDYDLGEQHRKRIDQLLEAHPEARSQGHGGAVRRCGLAIRNGMGSAPA